MCSRRTKINPPDGGSQRHNEVHANNEIKHYSVDIRWNIGTQRLFL
jgi:hypothetical protein